MNLKDYTIGSIIGALKEEGVKTADVAKAIEGISEKPLRNALKLAGYEFSNKAPKGWHFIGEGEEPTDKSIFDYVKPSSPSKKTSSPKVHTEITAVHTSEGEDEFTLNNTEITTVHTEFTPSNQVIHPQFTRDEITDLMAMLYEWRQGKQGQTIEEPTGNLHEQIKALATGEKTRKTIVINEAIGKELDEFCINEKVQKSDIIHLALRELFDKYRG